MKTVEGAFHLQHFFGRTHNFAWTLETLTETQWGNEAEINVCFYIYMQQSHNQSYGKKAWIKEEEPSMRLKGG